MLEPSEADAEANLRAAVELGQKLLDRNQQLLQEQLELRQQLSAKDAEIERLYGEANRASELDSRFQLATERLTLMEEERLGLLSEVKACASLKQRVKNLQQDEENLREEIITKETELKMLRRAMDKKNAEDLTPSLSRKDDASDGLIPRVKSSDAFKYEEYEHRIQTKDREIDELTRETLALADTIEGKTRLVETQRRQLRTYGSQVESLQLNIQKLQEDARKMAIEMETRERESSASNGGHDLMSELQAVGQQTGEDFSQMAAASKPRPAPVTPVDPAIVLPSSADDEIIQEYVRLKTEAMYRRAADEEFSLRYEQLKHNMEGARLWAVQAYIKAKGEHANDEQLKVLSRERLNNVALEAKLLSLRPGICELPHVRSVMSMMVEHIQTTKALNAALQVAKQLEASCTHTVELDKSVNEDGCIEVVEVVAVRERDVIIVEDAETGKEIYRVLYTRLDPSQVCKEVHAYFKNK